MYTGPTCVYSIKYTLSSTLLTRKLLPDNRESILFGTLLSCIYDFSRPCNPVVINATMYNTLHPIYWLATQS